MTKEGVFEQGKYRGYNIASWQDLPEIGIEITDHEVLCSYCGPNPPETIDDIADLFLLLCSEAEMHGRDFTPFEFTAKELNDLDADENIDFEPWEVYEEGLQAGYNQSWKEREGNYKE